MPHDRVTLVRLVADALVVAQRDPAASADLCKPHIVGRIMSEVIDMAFDGQTTRLQNRTKLFAKIAVGEIAARQAARS